MFKGLQVKSQRSSFAFKNSVQSRVKLARAGRRLPGRRQYSQIGYKVRISAQLVEAASGNQVWGRQYNAELEDVLNLEQELEPDHRRHRQRPRWPHAATVRVTQTGQGSEKLRFYLRGLTTSENLHRRTWPPQSSRFEQCIEIDPDNAERTCSWHDS